MQQKKVLSVFALAMINIAAIGSVKNWPLTAEYGLAALFFLALAALIFFIPTALVSAELATGWPREGGIFVWVKEAFGHRWGFLAIWLLWVENLLWYPTVLSFIAATAAFAINPDLASNKVYTALTVLTLFWGATLANLRGMRASSWISTMGALCGTFIPGVLIIGLGVLWALGGRPMQISFSWEALLPDMTSLKQIVFFTGVLLSLAGIEMSAIHARDVKHPKKDYPKAILLSAASILGLSMLGVLAIAMVIPREQISLVAGSMQAFSYFVNAYGLEGLVPVMAILLALGALGAMSTWTVGPSKGLHAAAQMGDLPPQLTKVNAQGMPTNLLIAQAILVSFLSLLFLFMPTISSAYWILTVLVSQLYLLMYILMFAAAIKLRYSRPAVHRAYEVPGGKMGMWIIAAVGIGSSLFTLIIGYLPPAQIPTGNVAFYVGFLGIGTVLSCLAPSIILWLNGKK